MKSASKLKYACKNTCIYYCEQKILFPAETHPPTVGRKEVHAPLACVMFLNKGLFYQDFDLFLFL